MTTLKVLQDYMDKHLQLARQELQEKYSKHREALRQKLVEKMELCMNEGNHIDLCKNRYARWVEENEPERSRVNYLECIDRAEDTRRNTQDRKLHLREMKRCIERFRDAAVKEVGNDIERKYAIFVEEIHKEKN